MLTPEHPVGAVHVSCVCAQVGMHFMHPAPVVPLVELAKGMHTSQQVGGQEGEGSRGEN